MGLIVKQECESSFLTFGLKRLIFATAILQEELEEIPWRGVVTVLD